MTKKEKFSAIVNYFKTNVPVAETELHYTNPFELVVAVSLSAQCTDKRINQVTPKLFKNFPTAEVMATSNVDVIFSYIRSVSYPNNKAKHLLGMAQMLVSDFNSEVPSEINDLIKLPGVGRKTANVVASVIYNKPAMAVDTHVFRVSNRLGLTKATNPLQSEQQLIKYIPEQYIATAHHWLILHGRYTCVARNPKCNDCNIQQWCSYYKTNFLKTKALPKLKMSAKKTEVIIETKKKVIEKTIKPIELKNKFIVHTSSLQIGCKAPLFKANNQNGKSISLTDFLGKKVALYFYPKDNTPGCTMQACSIRDDYKVLLKKQCVVIGVSADDEKKHKKFSDKFELPFSLLVDENKDIIKSYDVWGTKQFMGKIFDGIIRTTFLINEKGIIIDIIKEVKTKEHAKQLLERL